MKTILSLSGLAFLFLVLGATVFVVQKRQGIGEIAQVYPPSSVSVPPVSPSPASLPPSPPTTPTPSGLSVPTPTPTLGYILLTPPPVVGVPIIQATTPLGAVTQNNLSDWCRNNPDQCVADPAGFYRTMAGAAAPSVILTGVLTAPLWGPAAVDAAIAAGPTIANIGYWSTVAGTAVGMEGLTGQVITQVYSALTGEPFVDPRYPFTKTFDDITRNALYAGSGVAFLGQGIYSSGEQLSAPNKAYWSNKYDEAKLAVESTGAKVIDTSTELEAVGLQAVSSRGGYATLSRQIVLGEGFASEQDRLTALAHEYGHTELALNGGWAGWGSRSLAAYAETELFATGIGSRQVYAPSESLLEAKTFGKLLNIKTGADYYSTLNYNNWYGLDALNNIVLGTGYRIFDPARLLPTNKTIILRLWEEVIKFKYGKF